MGVGPSHPWRRPLPRTSRPEPEPPLDERWNEVVEVLLAARQLVRDAESWCAIGAIYRAAGHNRRGFAEEAIEALRDAGLDLDSVNDADGHKPTLRVFDEAVRVAEINVEEVPRRMVHWA